MRLHGAFFYFPSPRQVRASLRRLYSGETALAWKAKRKA
jgi:hypothetical protein